MAVTYKDIGDLSQKSSVAGTEKIPVSDTQFITPSQILTGYKKVVYLTNESGMPAQPDSNTLYAILANNTVVNIVYLTSESQMPASPDANTLYLILESE